MLSKNGREERELKIVHLFRRMLERFVEPFPEIPVGKEVEAQHRYQVRHRPREGRTEFEDLQEQYGDQRRPDLDVKGVDACPDKGLDPQVLLDCLEEVLDLPAVLVDGRNGGGGKGQVIGQEDERLLVLLVPHFDPSELLWAPLLAPVGVKLDLFIAEDVTVRGTFAAPDDIVGDIVLHPGDKNDPCFAPPVEEIIIGVALVNNHNTARRKGKILGHHSPGHPDLMDLPLSNMGERGQIPVVVEDHVQFDRPLGASKVGPVEHAQAQLDHRGVHAIQLVLEAELPFSPVIRSGLSEQMIKHLLVDLPAPVLVGIGQRGASGAFMQAQVVQFSHATGQAAANLSQRLGFAELAEEHTDQLLPAGKSLRATISTMFTDDTAEGVTISKVYDLCKKVCTFERHMSLRFVGLS